MRKHKFIKYGNLVVADAGTQKDSLEMPDSAKIGLTKSCTDPTKKEAMLYSVIAALDLQEEFHQTIEKSDLIEENGLITLTPSTTELGARIAEKVHFEYKKGKLKGYILLGDVRKVLKCS